MTTSVIIKTHGWPVRLTVHDTYDSTGPKSRMSTLGTTWEFVPANSEREIALTDTRSISVAELPADWVDLDGPEEDVEA